MANNDNLSLVIARSGISGALKAGLLDGGGGAVDSVNGKTGSVSLTAADVGAATTTQGTKADSAVQPATLTSSLAAKANQTDLNSLSTTVGTKANQTDLNTANTIIASNTLAVSKINPISNVAYFGDSRTRQNVSESGVTIPAVVARSPIWWMQTLSKGRLTMSYLYNHGVSGDSVAQLKDRIVNNVANPWGIYPNDPNYTFAVVLIGTNSVNSLVPLASMQADVNTIISTLKSWGKIPVIIAEWPRGLGTTPGTTGYLSVDSQKLMYRYSNWLRSLRTDPSLIIIDMWPEFADPASTAATPLANILNADGLHNNEGSAYLMGKKLAFELSKRVPPGNYTVSSNGDLYDATANTTGCLNANPMLQGTTGTVGTGASGTAPTSYALSTSGGVTVTGSNVTVNNRPAFRMVVTGTATSNNSYARLRINIPLANIAVGDKLIAGYEFAVSAGHANFGAPTVMIDPSNAAGTGVDRRYGGLTLTGDLVLPASAIEAYEGVSLQDYTVGSTLPTALNVEFRPMFISNIASSLTIDIFDAFVRKV